MDLKNLKLEDIKDSLLKFADKKTLIKIGISAGSIIVFLIIYYAILNPIVDKKKAQLTTMLEKQEETAKFISEINSKKKKINFCLKSRKSINLSQNDKSNENHIWRVHPTFEKSKSIDINSACSQT